LPNEINLKVGKLGIQRFPRGYYTYTGSALGVGSSSLKHRVLRHLKKKKQKFWHIDFLLDHKNAYLTGLVAAIATWFHAHGALVLVAALTFGVGAVIAITAALWAMAEANRAAAKSLDLLIHL